MIEMGFEMDAFVKRIGFEFIVVLLRLIGDTNGRVTEAVKEFLEGILGM